MSDFELRIIPNMRVTTFGALKKLRSNGKFERESVWRIDPSTGRPSANSAFEFTRNRLREDPWLIGTAVPIHPYKDPHIVPVQFLACRNGVIADIPMIDTGPWWGARKSNPFWLIGPNGDRPHAEKASKLWHQVKRYLPLVTDGQWVIDKVAGNMSETDKFRYSIDRLNEVCGRLRSEYGLHVTVKMLLDDKYRIPAQVPHSVGLDFTPGAWRELGVHRATPEAYANYSGNIDAAIFVVPSGLSWGDIDVQV